MNEREVTDSQMSSYVPQELAHEWVDQGGIRPTEAGLERMDYILPRLLKKSSDE